MELGQIKGHIGLVQNEKDEAAAQIAQLKEKCSSVESEMGALEKERVEVEKAMEKLNTELNQSKQALMMKSDEYEEHLKQAKETHNAEIVSLKDENHQKESKIIE